MVTYPQDWGKYELGVLFDISAGGDVNKNCFSKSKTIEHPYEVFSNGVDNRGLYGYTSTPLHEGDSITVTARGTIGKAFYRSEPYDAIIRLLVLAPKHDDVNSMFYTYFINNNIVFEDEHTGVPQLTAPKIKRIHVTKPSRPEQDAIAETLSCIDAHIANLTELIEKKKGIRDGALEDLVSGRTQLKGVDIVWEETELGRIATYRKGRTTSEKKRYISTENIRQEFSGITPYSGSYEVDGCEFSKGDILMANIRPYLKKIWYADFSGCCSADVLVIHANEGIASTYLYYLVANDRYINYVMNGGTKGIKMPRGDKGFIMHYPLLIPIDEKIQQTISDMLTSMDDEIFDLEEEKDKMLQIKAGAMDDLLTGRVRLTRQGG